MQCTAEGPRDGNAPTATSEIPKPFASSRNLWGQPLELSFVVERGLAQLPKRMGSERWCP
jgi:hypothetical protein